ncbi:MAG: hypothetical protein Q9171_002508 [Xanthocarpia ochracea]
MHEYRSSAHQQAWYQEDGESTNFNPFAKRRAPKGNLTDNDEENACCTRTNQSDNQVVSVAELDRRSQNRDTFPGPPHSSSMPAQTKKGPFPPANGLLEHPAETGKSKESETATIVPEDEHASLPITSEEKGPRKRKIGGFLDRFYGNRGYRGPAKSHPSQFAHQHPVVLSCQSVSVFTSVK